ncbi:hypothetical protein Hanom_Chr05g00413681 [Helianthus anomalus]
MFNHWFNFYMFNIWFNLFFRFYCCLIVTRRRMTFRVLSISYLRYHVGWTFYSGTVLRILCGCV